MTNARCHLQTLAGMLTSGFRPDGRKNLEYREIKIEFPSIAATGPQAGCCTVKFGGTRVMACVKSEVVEPRPHHPTKGVLYVYINTTALRIATPGLGNPRNINREANQIEATLKKCLGFCLDLDSLCIHPGKKVFLIRLDVHLLCDDGNLLDCAALATATAITTFKRPDIINVDGEMIVDEKFEQKPPVHLNLSKVPIIVSIGVVPAAPPLANVTTTTSKTTPTNKVVTTRAHNMFIDLTLNEEEVITNRLVIGMSNVQELCVMSTWCHSAFLNERFLTNCIQLVEHKVHQLYQLIRHAATTLQQQSADGNSIEISSVQFLKSSSLNQSLKTTESIEKSEKNIDEDVNEIDGEENDAGGDGEFDVDEEKIREERGKTNAEPIIDKRWLAKLRPNYNTSAH